jgi:hypothetical protein
MTRYKGRLSANAIERDLMMHRHADQNMPVMVIDNPF